jgi:hypothetical protein
MPKVVQKKKSNGTPQAINFPCYKPARVIEAPVNNKNKNQVMIQEAFYKRVQGKNSF